MPGQGFVHLGRPVADRRQDEIENGVNRSHALAGQVILCMCVSRKLCATRACAQIVRDPRTKKSKGYGFVSFTDSNDFAKALREMNGKYIGNRPCKLSKSNWDERTIRKVNYKEPASKKQKK